MSNSRIGWLLALCLSWLWCSSTKSRRDVVFAELDKKDFVTSPEHSVSLSHPAILGLSSSEVYICETPEFSLSRQMPPKCLSLMHKDCDPIETIAASSSDCLFKTQKSSVIFSSWCNPLRYRRNERRGIFSHMFLSSRWNPLTSTSWLRTVIFWAPYRRSILSIEKIEVRRWPPGLALSGTISDLLLFNSSQLGCLRNFRSITIGRLITSLRNLSELRSVSAVIRISEISVRKVSIDSCSLRNILRHHHSTISTTDYYQNEVFITALTIDYSQCLHFRWSILIFRLYLCKCGKRVFLIN